MISVDAKMLARPWAHARGDESEQSPSRAWSKVQFLLTEDEGSSEEDEDLKDLLAAYRL